MTLLNSRPSGVSRREALKRLASSAVAARIGLLTALSSHLSVTRVEAAIPPALPLIAAAANLISGFMRGDGGMGALLGAINQKLDIVIGQLAKVQLALADISEALTLLPDEIEELLKQQYVIEKISTMRGAIGEYLELQASLVGQRSPSGARPQTLRTLDSQWLTEIYKRFNGARRELMASPHGCRPDAALFAPAAFIFDLSINLTIETPNPVLVELVRGYRDWYVRIEDAVVSGSTRQHLDSTIDRHFELQRSLGSHSNGRAVGFRPPRAVPRRPTVGGGLLDTTIIDLEELLNPSPKFPLTETLAADSGCHAAAELQFGAGLPTSGLGISVGVAKATAVTSRVALWEAETVLAKGFSVRLLQTSVSRTPKNWKQGDPPEYFRYTPPPGCNVTQAFVADLDAQFLANPAWQNQLQGEKSFLILIDEINAERVRIAAYLSVLSEVGRARTSTSVWIQQLGGAAL